MSSSRQSVNQSKSFRKMLTDIFPDRLHRHIAFEIEDDWELVDHEILDDEKDFAGDYQYSDVTELPDHLSSPWLNLPSPPINFKILKKADVRQRLEDRIVTICDVLPLLRAEATILLCHFKWSVEWILEQWLECEVKTRRAVGLFERPIIDISDAAEEQRACGNCCQNFSGQVMFAVSCGHQFCRSCWTGYISEAISDGPKCLALRCLDSSCNAAVGRDMVELLSSEEDNKMFENYLLKSYLSSCKEAKWCPGPACEYALFSSASGDINSSSVTCLCLYILCWNCGSEAHSPVDCNTVAKWMTEISAQSENWVTANTRPCPNCKFPVALEPGLGFLHCIICNHEFCCDCGCGLSGHCDDTDYDCPSSETSRPDGFRLDDHYEREIVKKKLERYNCYYESWAIYESLRANAVTDLKLFMDVLLEMMCILGFPAGSLGFLVKAKLQIAECWQILKWTCVYGYFLNEEELAKAHLLKFMQERAEDVTRQLDKYVEEVKDLLLNEDMAFTHLVSYKHNLVSLTHVTRTHFDRIEAALKAGLSEVCCVPSPSPPNLKHTQRQTPSLTTLPEESSGNEQTLSQTSD